MADAKVAITIPNGIRPGGKFKANVGGSIGIVMLECPSNLGPGKQLLVDPATLVETRLAELRLRLSELEGKANKKERGVVNKEVLKLEKELQDLAAGRAAAAVVVPNQVCVRVAEDFSGREAYLSVGCTVVDKGSPGDVFISACCPCWFPFYQGRFAGCPDVACCGSDPNPMAAFCCGCGCEDGCSPGPIAWGCCLMCYFPAALLSLYAPETVNVGPCCFWGGGDTKKASAIYPPCLMRPSNDHRVNEKMWRYESDIDI